jgi:molecular chaperone DnaJ
MSKSYYEELGISAKATPDEIRTAYRRLALQYHPDTTQEDKTSSEVRFRAIAEAYEVLSDPQKRNKYDQIPSGGSRSPFGDFFTQFNPNAPQKGENLVVTLHVEMKKILTDSDHIVSIERDEYCDQCHGAGHKPGTSKISCRPCNGNGRTVNEWSHGHQRIREVRVCNACQGTGQAIDSKDRCNNCQNGLTKSRHEFSIKVPAGITSNYSVGVREEGGLGRNGGPRGDVIVRVFARHEQFLRASDAPHNLIMEMPISYVQACLGDKIDVEMVNEEMREIVIPSYCQNGQVIVVQGQGLPVMGFNNRGDLYIRLSVQVPTSISEPERELLKQLEELQRGKNVQKNNHQQKNS